MLFRSNLNNTTIHRVVVNSVRKKHKKWESPTEFDSGIQIFNPITKSKVPLVFRHKHLIKWYMCGPTVYDSSHIGHASCYMRFDIIRRIMDKFFGVKPIVALGITDIDDKIINRSKELGMEFQQLAKQYETEFFTDINLLNIKEPSFVLRVSEHIPLIIQFVEKLVDSKQGYVTEDGSVYFNTRMFEGYGKLSPAGAQGHTLQLGQQSSLDFALWKGAKPGEPSWQSPWGRGRPGWHVECSAMASDLFGAALDMHSGGLDLVFPHHENEEAQSCAFHGTRQWVDYWLHSGHLLMNGEKMSKSLKNFIPISGFLEKYTADQLRMFCLLSHYRSGVDYTDPAMTNAVAICDKMGSFLLDADAYVQGRWDRGDVAESVLLQALQETSTAVKKLLADDFNTPECVAALQKLVGLTSKMMYHSPQHDFARSPAVVAVVSNFVRDWFQSVGLWQKAKTVSEKPTLAYLVEKSINFRSSVRSRALASSDKTQKQHLLQACDLMRTELETIGVYVKDTDKKHTSWSLKSPNI